MTWLVTGGAGYIGAHIVRAFLSHSIPVVALDDLSSGRREFVPPTVPFAEASILDAEALRVLFGNYGIDGVVHVAGFKYAGVSVSRPLHTYRQNVTGTLTLLEQMAEAGVGRMVFSSSAAVYGTPDVPLVTEDSPKRPESPYGESKLIAEWLLRDQAAARDLAHTSLRYFNVVGSGYEDVYDASPHNLLPLVFEALLSGRTPTIFGSDYGTPDGTCVRDYIHVDDLAISHVAAAMSLARGEPLEPAYNLGSGSGASVAQIMAAVARVTGITFVSELATRRAGDPARIVASGELARRDLNWRMRHELHDMVASAWRARLKAAP